MFDITCTSHRITRIDVEDDWAGTYRFDRDHRVILSDPAPISVEKTVYRTFESLPRWLQNDYLETYEDLFPVTVLEATYPEHEEIGDFLLLEDANATRVYDAYGRVLFKQYRYFYYDDKGRLKKVMMWVEGTKYETFFMYDSNGNVSCQVETEDDSLLSITKYEILRTDGYENWTVRNCRSLRDDGTWDSGCLEKRRIWYDD